MATTSLSQQTLHSLTARLKNDNQAVAKHYPGEAATRQPVRL